MVVPATVRDAQLTRLVSLGSPDARSVGLVRRVCVQTMSLPPLPVEVEVVQPSAEAEAVVAEFAEQFSADVSAITAEQRSLLFKTLGDSTFVVVVAMYIADFVPWVRAGLEALGLGSSLLGWTRGPIEWDHATDPSGEVFDEFLPFVGRLRALDPLTSGLVRLRGAGAHNGRLCKSVRESRALEAGVRRRSTTTSRSSSSRR